MTRRKRLANQINNSFDKSILNNLWKKVSYGGLLGKHIQITQEEVEQLTKLADDSNNNLVTKLKANPQLTQWFQQYTVWNQTHGKYLVRFVFPNNVVKNGGNIQSIQETETQITVPQELYTLLTWQSIGQSLRTVIKQIGPQGIMNEHHPQYGIDSSSLKNVLWKLSQLTKT